MSIWCWMGLHRWEWRMTRFDPGSNGFLKSTVLYRCKRCEKARFK